MVTRMRLSRNKMYLFMDLECGGKVTISTMTSSASVDDGYTMKGVTIYCLDKYHPGLMTVALEYRRKIRMINSGELDPVDAISDDDTFNELIISTMSL